MARGFPGKASRRPVVVHSGHYLGTPSQEAASIVRGRADEPHTGLQDREVETAGAVHGMDDCELQHAEGAEEADSDPWLLGGLAGVCGDSVSDVDGEESELGGSDGGG